MFKSLAAAFILASGLVSGSVLGAAPAAAHEWGDRYGGGYSQNEDFNRGQDPRAWRRGGDDDHRWSRIEDGDRWGWGWGQARHHWRRHCDDRHAWGRDNGYYGERFF